MELEARGPKADKPDAPMPDFPLADEVASESEAEEDPPGLPVGRINPLFVDEDESSEV